MHMFESSPGMFESRPEARVLAQQLARYREPNNARGVFELTITAWPSCIIWAVISIVLVHGHWSGLLLMVPAAALVVRLFMIQHDCGHGSSFTVALRTTGSAARSALGASRLALT